MSSEPTGHGERAAATAAAAGALDPSPLASLAVTGLGKCYQTYARPFDRLKQALLGWRGHRFYRDFWALRDVSFELRRGEAIGIVGRNGSGKSTLLQIIAGTLPPSTGEARIEGRVGALLELGSGFNPEFSGRENITLQGTLLGFTPEQIKARLPQIEAFAEIGDFVEQPVKTYSSGMFVRLAFAVQVMLEPEILIVDEALAVGDAAFQIKCMAHMRRMLERGVALLLTTHDVEAVRGMCSTALWLDGGRVRAHGNPREITTAYMRHMVGGDTVPPLRRPVADGRHSEPAAPAPAGPPPALAPLADLLARADIVRWGDGRASLTGFRLDGDTPEAATPVAAQYHNGERLRLLVELHANDDLDGSGLAVAFSIRNVKALNLITYSTFEGGETLPSVPCGTRLRLLFTFDNILPSGDYGLVLAVEQVHMHGRRYLDFVENALVFHVSAARPSFSVVAPPVTVAIQTPTQAATARKG